MIVQHQDIAFGTVRLVRLMTEASIAADVDPTCRGAWMMGVAMMERAEAAQSGEEALQCLAAATECFSAAAGRKYPCRFLAHAS